MKKGFTLIELLAVILILGIIALIAVPQVTNVIENASKGAAETSAEHYISAVSNTIALNELDSDKNNDIKDGYRVIKNLDIKMNGNIPESGIVHIENGNVVGATFIVNGYDVECDAKGKCNAIKNGYVYYSSAGLGITNASEGLDKRPTDKRVYLKYPIVNGELQTPQVCLYYNDTEICLNNNESEISEKKILDFFDYNESTWFNYQTSKISPSQDFFCHIKREESFLEYSAIATTCGYNKSPDISLYEDIPGAVMAQDDLNKYGCAVLPNGEHGCQNYE